MIRILDEIRSRMINSAELFRALRFIVIEQDVANAYSLEELKETGGPTAEKRFQEEKYTAPKRANMAFRNVFERN